MAEAYGFKPSGVPTTFIGDQYWVGFTDTIKDQMQAAVAKCLVTGCTDLGEGIIDINGQSGIEKTITPVPPAFDPLLILINVPIIGRSLLNAQSLTISTLLISFADGVNPCSIWVLSMLTALVIHTVLKEILIIGLIFLTVTAGIYAMFIAGLFSVLKDHQFCRLDPGHRCPSSIFLLS